MKHIYRFLVFFLVFGVSSFLWYKVLWAGTQDFDVNLTITEMADASFPLVTIKTGEETINSLHGYASALDASAVRNNITPVDKEQAFFVYMEEAAARPKKVNYEIRSADGDSILESDSILALEKDDDGNRYVKIKIQTGLTEGEEYPVRITLVTDTNKKIHYYTRVKYYEDGHLEEKIDFALDFHSKTLDKKKAEELSRYLEPDHKVQSESLHEVTIGSQLNLVSWAEMAPEVVTPVVPAVKEMNPETASIELDYMVASTGPAGQELYTVKEFFRVKYTADRMYLLSYRRTMEEVFDISQASLAKSELKLGIINEDHFSFLAGEDGSRVCFVANHALWSYDLNLNKASLVFSFYQNPETYKWEGYDQHEVRILNMDDDGNIDFMVYGYMNRGDYEGKVAVILYRYYAAENRMKERVYIPVSVPYQFLKEEIEQFAYVSKSEIFYFSVNHQIYAYNMTTRDCEIIAPDVSEESFLASSEGGYAIWQNNVQAQESTELILQDMETGKQNRFSARKNENIVLLGQTETDMVIGYVKTKDIRENIDGSVTVPAYEVAIIDSAGNTLKNYKKKGIYVAGVQVEDHVVSLNTVKKNGNGYEARKTEYIISRSENGSEAVTLSSRVTDRALTEYYLSLPETFKMEGLPEQEKALNTVIVEDLTLRLEMQQNDTGRYYIYAWGSIMGHTDSAAEAITLADENMGVVADGTNRIIWERGGRESRHGIQNIAAQYCSSGVTSMGACLAMILDKEFVTADAADLSAQKGSALKLLNENLSALPVNLTGCSLDEVLYFVGKDRPVIALKEGQNAVLIIGYDTEYIKFVDPAAGRTQIIRLSAAQAQFERAGNVFISYVK
ncbi:hypothetical protein [Anaerolentibacter hominis]|uniref:hypothetical protein n=1 Tax=Anaerolentibacter hominis TaxID=3079009 RepID=UPI0031B869B9